MRTLLALCLLLSASPGNALGGSPKISANVHSGIATQVHESIGKVTASEAKHASDRLHYYGARYYDPVTSVWQSTDPMLLSQGTRGLAAYTYVANNPLRLVDPDGREFEDAAHPRTSANTRDGLSEFARENPEEAAQVMRVVGGSMPVAGDVADAAEFGHDLGSGNFGDAFWSALGTVIPLVGAAAVKAGGKALLNAVTEGGGAGGDAGKALKKTADAAGDGAGDGKKFFRGAREGEAPDLTPRPNDYKVDKATGKVKDSHGVSVFDNAQSVEKKGFVAHEVDQSTIPDSLRVKQRGRDPSHYEVTPKPGANLSPDEFSAACSGIGCK